MGLVHVRLFGMIPAYMSDLISKGKWVFGFHLEYQFEGAYLFAVRGGFYLVSYISVAIW